MRAMERPLDTMLVAFDDSEPARRALTRAADLAERLGARLVVVAVAAPPLPAVGIESALPGAGPEALAARGTYEVDHADRSLEDDRRVLEQRPVRAEYVAELGSPAERIVALAEAHDADIVVVGTREPGFLDRLFGGSVSDDVSHGTSRDVLIVH